MIVSNFPASTVCGVVPSGFGQTSLALGEHLCHFYCSIEHHLCTLTPFVKAGIHNHEQCLFISDRQLRQQQIDWLNALDFGVPGQSRLEIVAIDSFLPLAEEQAWIRMQTLLTEQMQVARQSGLSSLRVAIDMASVIERMGLNKALQIEEFLNDLAPTLPIVLLCGYYFDPRTMLALARVHGKVLNAISAQPNNHQGLWE
jgi:hypothetical protein